MTKRHYEYGQEALSELFPSHLEVFKTAPTTEILLRTLQNAAFINQCIHISENFNAKITLFISLN